ncbi:hypothetical protein F2P56_000511 [Juglans regia]|uniref:Uncharacterized protein LOC109010176 n=2 Tax=Juglans regia TaxID=51240 RepID=A0A2I4GRD7_JUGRE|nr:uncharacterized protein LOC109010176 [Juglans regia]KAF5479713.1 hypothetical protein F2P56_000511 [Juglans regia]
MAMSLTAKFPYQRLGHDVGFDDHDEERDRVVMRSRGWYRFKRVSIRRRFRLKVPNLRRLLRRKVRLLSAVRVSWSWAKVARRFKESQAHFGDLFAGNYLFVQVNPSSLKCLKRDNDLNGLSSSYSLPRVLA